MHLFIDPDWRELGAGVLAASSACCVTVASWRYLVRNRLEVRMRRISGEREQIRQRARDLRSPRGADEDPITAIRRANASWAGRLIALFGFDEPAEGSGISIMLQTAGYRGRTAYVTYVAMRLLCPIVTFALTLLYLTAVIGAELPTSAHLLIATATGGLGYYMPALYVRNRTLKRQQSIQRAWPDALDLLLICVQSGMAVEPALQKVSGEIGSQSIDLAEELGLTTAELSYLPERSQAYENLARRTGLDCVKAVVSSLKQSEKQGTAIGRSLRVLAQENRDLRLSLAEKTAAALPPKLTVPMILFFLPVLFVVILTPSIIQIAEKM